MSYTTSIGSYTSLYARILSYRKFLIRSFFTLLFFLVLYGILIYKLVFFLNTPWDWFAGVYSLLTGAFLLSRFAIVLFYSDNHTGTFKSKRYPTISVVIACKNEEDSIYKTIETCMQSEYPKPIECIAVDDGSTDNTYAEMERAEKDFNGVRLIKFDKNRGKREGMAEGVLIARNEVIVFVDSDSFVKKDAIKIIAEHFIYDDKVGAVSGNSKVENIDTNALTKMQSARYGVSFDIFKACEGVFGTVTCCPGCFSAYRRKAIMEVINAWRYQMFLGTRSTFGDDRSLTNHVLRKWKVEYCITAEATTIVPDKYKKFFKQQFRWKKSWIREGTNAAKFIWRKHPIAALSFYTNLLIPIFGPFIVGYVLYYSFYVQNALPFVYFGGLTAMSVLFGAFYYIRSENKYWWYVILFTWLYSIVLIWQMPYALLKLRDTKWGTR